MEGIPQPKVEKKETNEQPQHYVEEVVASTQEVRSECLRDPNSPMCNVELLHSQIEHSDVGEAFKYYEEHKILTLDDITKSIQNVIEYLGGEIPKLDEDTEEYQFAQSKYKLLQKRADEIRTGVQRYVRTLSQFFQLSKQRMRLEPEDYRDKIQEIDKRRRVCHDALIQTLAVYSTSVANLKEYGFLEEYEVLAWDHSTDLSNGITENNSCIIVFNAKILQNRDLVKDWAISAHLHEQIEQIGKIKENGTMINGAIEV